MENRHFSLETGHPALMVEVENLGNTSESIGARLNF